MDGIIDAHAHIVHRVDAEHPRTSSSLFPAAMHIPSERLISEMIAHGIARTIIYPTGVDDSYAQRSQNLHPEKFSVIAEIGSVDELVRQLSSYRISGVRLVGDPDRSNPLFFDRGLLSVIADCNLILSVYLGPSDFDGLLYAAEASPRIRFLVNHCGFPLRMGTVGPFSRPSIQPPSSLDFRRLEQLAGFPNIHVCISGLYAFSRELFPYSDILPMAQAVARAFGIDRLIWGSDYPFTASEPGVHRLIESVGSLIGSTNILDHQAVLGGNASRLLWLTLAN